MYSHADYIIWIASCKMHCCADGIMRITLYKLHYTNCIVIIASWSLYRDHYAHIIVQIFLSDCAMGIILWELHYKDYIIGIVLFGFCYNYANFAITMEILLCRCILLAIFKKTYADQLCAFS